VPSYRQDLPFAVNTWFNIGDDGKLSAAIIYSQKGKVY
jgi:hypothetical protein